MTNRVKDSLDAFYNAWMGDIGMGDERAVNSMSQAAMSQAYSNKLDSDAMKALMSRRQANAAADMLRQPPQSYYGVRQEEWTSVFKNLSAYSSPKESEFAMKSAASRVGLGTPEIMTNGAGPVLYMSKLIAELTRRHLLKDDVGSFSSKEFNASTLRQMIVSRGRVAIPNMAIERDAASMGARVIVSMDADYVHPMFRNMRFAKDIGARAILRPDELNAEAVMNDVTAALSEISDRINTIALALARAAYDLCMSRRRRVKALFDYHRTTPDFQTWMERVKAEAQEGMGLDATAKNTLRMYDILPADAAAGAQITMQSGPLNVVELRASPRMLVQDELTVVVSALDELTLTEMQLGVEVVRVPEWHERIERVMDDGMTANAVDSTLTNEFDKIIGGAYTEQG